MRVMTMVIAHFPLVIEHYPSRHRLSLLSLSTFLRIIRTRALPWGKYTSPLRCVQSMSSLLCRSQSAESASILNNMMSKCYSYLPFVSPPTPSDSLVSQSLFGLLTVPFHFLKNTIFSTPPSSPEALPSSPTSESNLFDIPSLVFPTASSASLEFDLYIASGENDAYWLDTVALPTLNENNITFTKRQAHQDSDILDPVQDMQVRQHSRVLYYLINGEERLSHMAAELAYLIGERKHKIVVFLQPNIDEHADAIRSPCERRDIQRSRKYLEDLARKENILLSHSKEESWQHVLSFFRGHRK